MRKKLDEVVFRPTGRGLALRRSTENDEVYFHWSAVSQRYAPVEVLLQYLRFGWKPDGTIAVEEFCFRGARYTKIYYFRLLYLEESFWIPVLENPIVLRLIREHKLSQHLAAPNCESDAVDNTCQGCCESNGDSDLIRRCQGGCTCVGNVAIHCCCVSRLLPSI